jgi:MoaA/NifB/PqqE/SkfB family radical SAM enzyme
MDPGLFRKVIDEIGDNLFILYLWNWGEPFLNPAIYEMIAYARGKGIKVVTDNNQLGWDGQPLLLRSRWKILTRQ